ncbi:MAG: prolipoprotein diacylglyceryl transferase [Longimicrobiales bacterium]|nr:prolipoprotein diacylglyceryl transferase [Longimicrobiales bacterium]
MYPILFELPEWLPILGGEPITTFGVFMLFSFLTAGYVLRSELGRKGHDPEKAWDMVFMAVIGGILGAKIYYILLNFDRLVADPMPLILARGGLVWYGGFTLASILVLWEVRRSKLPMLGAMDASAPALALAYAVGRVGCFLVGDDWGRPTGSWVGIRFPQGAPPTSVDVLERDFGITVDPALVEKFGQVVPVHPTQLYEVAISTLIFLFLWRIRKQDRRAGWLFMVWLALAGAERFAVEFFRAKDDRFFGALTLAQVISMAIVAGGIAGMVRLSGKQKGRAR